MIKIFFTDFWPGFEKNNLFFEFLKKYFDVVISAQPDYLFYSVYGLSHLKYKDCVKIFYTGENLIPDFNLCDYAIGFHYIDFENRYMRFPLYVYYQWYYSNIFSGNKVLFEKSNVSDNVLLNRKFCNFVYSNMVNSDPIRDKFFQELSKYKNVDSGGRHLNNIGGPVPDKLEFIKNYKFTIAFENSSVPGYTTEKIIEPMLMNTMPLYFGNPLIHKDFNVKSFVNVKDLTDFDRAIDEIIYLDTNDDAYIEKLSHTSAADWNTIDFWEAKLKDFLGNIFNQDFISAKRKSEHGFNKRYTDQLQLQTDLMEKQKKLNSYKTRIKKFLGI